MFTACGPSEVEKEDAEKAYVDSIALVKQDTLEKQEVTKDSVIAVVETDQKVLKQKLAHLKAACQKENAKLEDVKHQHKFLRSKHKKEEAIEEQAKVVEHLQNQIKQIEKELAVEKR